MAYEVSNSSAQMMAVQSREPGYLRLVSALNEGLISGYEQLKA